MSWFKIIIESFNEPQASQLCTETTVTSDKHIHAKSEHLILLLDIFLISSGH